MLYFTKQELTCLADTFGYLNLEGADFVEFNREECINSLLEKGYITPYADRFELSNECRLLLSAWENIRYTLTKDSALLEDHVHAILASSRSIISYSLHFNDIQMVMCDFSAEVMDKVFADYLDIPAFDNCKSGFNITLSAEEYIYCFGQEISNELISKKTGLSYDDVSLIKKALNDENGTSFMVKDIRDEVVYAGILFKYSNEYVLIKDIVPNNNFDMQKVVIVKGNSVDIIDSIYIV